MAKIASKAKLGIPSGLGLIKNMAFIVAIVSILTLLMPLFIPDLKKSFIETGLITATPAFYIITILTILTWSLLYLVIKKPNYSLYNIVIVLLNLEMITFIFYDRIKYLFFDILFILLWVLIIWYLTQLKNYFKDTKINVDDKKIIKVNNIFNIAITVILILAILRFLALLF